MKKAAIQTIQDINLGNRLQNYAVEQVLSRCGVEAETLPPRISKPRQFLRTGRLLLKKKHLRSRYYFRRAQVFSAWNRAHIHYAPLSLTARRTPAGLTRRYDYFIAGSDQVWNPSFAGTDAMFLSFAPPGRRMAYAASFGVERLPAEHLDRYRRELSRFSALSVREEAGAELIHTLTGRDAARLADPTMMLTPAQWNQIASPPPWLGQGEYILLYSLGGLPQEIRSFAQAQAEKARCGLIEVMRPDQKDWYLIDPSQFLYLTAHAKLVVTDSFHGCVFSILYQIPFAVFDRADVPPEKEMNSRLDSLLELFRLTDRRLERLTGGGDLYRCDFSHTLPILEAERRKAMDFLRESFCRIDQTGKEGVRP